MTEERDRREEDREAKDRQMEKDASPEAVEKEEESGGALPQNRPEEGETPNEEG